MHDIVSYLNLLHDYVPCASLAKVKILFSLGHFWVGYSA